MLSDGKSLLMGIGRHIGILVIHHPPAPELPVAVLVSPPPVVKSVTPIIFIELAISLIHKVVIPTIFIVDFVSLEMNFRDQAI